MSEISTFNRVTRPTIMEYASVLVNIDQIIAQYSRNDSQDTKVIKARSLVSLLYVLESMQSMGLSGSEPLYNLSKAVTNRAQPVVNLIYQGSPSDIAAAMDTFVYVNGSTKTVVTNQSGGALDPTLWVDDDQNPVKIQDAISDYCFFEVYRHTDATLVGDMGLLANRLQASKQFLNAINDVYAGSAWNPGTQYINTTGNLQDYVDGSNIYHAWYDQFNSDNISVRMTTGITNLQTLIDASIFATDSIEYQTATYITNIFNATYDDGGYAQVATSAGAQRMWNDQQFRLKLQNGIESTSRLNDQAQLNLARILANYDFFVRTSTNIVTRDGEMGRTVANHIKDI